MSNNFFIDIIIIVIVQSILLLIYNFLRKKYQNNNGYLESKLKILNAILQSTKHDKILSLEQIKVIELDSKEVYVFSKDLYRDIKDNGQFPDNMHNIGTFYDTVEENLSKKNVLYTYFLKKDSHWKHFIHSFLNSYSNIGNNVFFFFIPADKYFFYNEVYLYKLSKQDKYRSFEFLPSISDEKEQRLFYLELDEKQTSRLVGIKKMLVKSYEKHSVNDLLEKVKVSSL